jgi:O-methyltransferase domain
VAAIAAGDSFAYMAQQPDEAANFDSAMAGFTRRIAIAVAASYDFSPFRRIIDIGGGSGALQEIEEDARERRIGLKDALDNGISGAREERRNQSTSPASIRLRLFLNASRDYETCSTNFAGRFTEDLYVGQQRPPPV